MRKAVLQPTADWFFIIELLLASLNVLIQIFPLVIFLTICLLLYLPTLGYSMKWFGYYENFFAKTMDFIINKFDKREGGEQ